MRPCVIRDTVGTAPQAGIDFEPNARDQWLQGIVVRNCRFEDNQGRRRDYFHLSPGRQ